MSNLAMVRADSRFQKIGPLRHDVPADAATDRDEQICVSVLRSRSSGSGYCPVKTASYLTGEVISTSQIRRAAVSIPSNIGVGKRRKRQRVFLHHLDIALGSQGELEVQLEIAKRLGLAMPEDSEAVADRLAEVGRMLNGLIVALRNDEQTR